MLLQEELGPKGRNHLVGATADGFEKNKNFPSSATGTTQILPVNGFNFFLRNPRLLQHTVAFCYQNLV